MKNLSAYLRQEDTRENSRRGGRRFPALVRPRFPSSLHVVPAAAMDPAPAADAYETTVLPHLPFLRAQALSLARRPEDAEDLVQETCLRALRSFHLFTPGTNARAWLGRILKNIFINRWRSQRRDGLSGPNLASAEEISEIPAPSPPGRPINPGQAFELRREEEFVESVLNGVPEPFRAVLRLQLDGFSYQEMADRLQVPIGTIMSRLHRARQHAGRLVAGRGRFGPRRHGSTSSAPGTKIRSAGRPGRATPATREYDVEAEVPLEAEDPLEDSFDDRLRTLVRPARRMRREGWREIAGLADRLVTSPGRSKS